MESTKKIGYLEGIRGVAAMLVVLHHFLLAFYPSYYFGGDPTSLHLPHNLELRYWQSPLSIITNGEFMVALFFVLSGFVLSRSYFQTGQVETLASSAARRYLRLYIPVAFAVALGYIALLCNVGLVNQTADITNSTWLRQTVSGDSSIKTFLGCFFYHTMFFIDGRYVTSTWSISVELAGSMFVFAILALTHKIRNKWVVFTICGIIFYLLFYDYFLAFTTGILLNYLDRIPHEKIKYRAILATVFIIIGLLLGGYPTWQWTPERETFYRFISYPILGNNTKTVHLIGATFLIMGAMLSNRFQKIFSGKIFIFLGDISFSAYLIHPIIVTTLSLLVFLQMYNITGHYAISVFISLLSTMVVTIIAAKLMAKYIDKPGVRFSKYVYTRFFKSKETDSTL